MYNCYDVCKVIDFEYEVVVKPDIQPYLVRIVYTKNDDFINWFTTKHIQDSYILYSPFNL